MPTWLDLFSGLGGFSQPAVDRGWRVIRLDNDPQFKPTIVADVLALPLKHFSIDVLSASPPCQDFSKWGLRCFYPNPPEPDLSIALAVKDAIAVWKPRFWVVENVWASRPWLTKLFGQVRALPPGHALWSNLGFLLPNLPGHKGLHGSPSGKKRWALGDRPHARSFVPHLRDAPAEAAKIPYEIGLAVALAAEREILHAKS